MIIDQLPLLLGDALLTDEFPIERGTTSYKATLEQILGLAFSEIEPNFSGAYDSTSTYAVGDYVVYEHDLYVCNTAISTAEAWTAAHWTQTDIGTVLESFKSAVDALGTSKQDKITANGILKGNGSAVSAATKGADYGSDAIQITLTAAGWASNEQTISNAFFASGFVFLAEPVQASKADYGSAGVYADDVSTSGQLTFHCTTSPSSDLAVNVVRIVSASGKTINIAGGGSSGGSEWELLWTNPNPTSAFAAQTIPLDLSNVQEVNLVIQHDLGGSADWHYTIPQMVSAGKQAFVAVQGVGSSGTIGAIRRVFTVSTTGVEFEGGTNKSGTSAPSADNSVGIPLQIYGR